jgi:hypothetical protein
MRELPDEQSWRKFAPVANVTHLIGPPCMTAKNSAVRYSRDSVVTSDRVRCVSVTTHRSIGCMHFNDATPECNCWNRGPYLASTPWLDAMAAATTRKQHGETSMTTKAGKLTTFALAAALGTALAVPATAQDVSANVGVNANVGATATVGVNAGAGAATGGVTGLLGGLLNDVTGLLGGLGLGGIL